MKKRLLLQLVLLFIITLPAFFSLLHAGYFSMHDDQHIARLYLLDKGLRQGYLYPRWVDLLGFNFGYPLFNFYPPLVYYAGEIFHLLGFDLASSVKAVFILGFYLSACGIYFLFKRWRGWIGAFLAAVMYVYFFYHAVLIYVRGALAEFFAMAVIPFVFIAIDRLAQKQSKTNAALLGIALAAINLTHPLIAFPFMIFYGATYIFYWLQARVKAKFTGHFLLGSILGMGLSSFYWLPSMLERKFTMVDELLTKDLANYKIHFVYPGQLLNSPWGFGGSIAGPNDGMTFQLGTGHILLSLFAVCGLFYYILAKRKPVAQFGKVVFLLIMASLSIFLTLNASGFVWDRIKYLWYLQFPWRFLTFAGFFISLLCGFGFTVIQEIVNAVVGILRAGKNGKTVAISVILVAFSVVFIAKYAKYFKPQRYVNMPVAQLTSFEEIAWRISKSSFEFSPKGIKTARTDLNIKTADIASPAEVVRQPFIFPDNRGEADTVRNLFMEKIFIVRTANPTVFRANTFYFPGWTAYIDGKQTAIDNNNDFKLMTVIVPAGEHRVEFHYHGTAVQMTGEIFTIISFVVILYYLIYGKRNHAKS